MTYDALGPGALDYLPCRYGASKLLFRGPKRDLDAPYIAFLGGTETYGKFIELPFPALVEQELAMTCANFGQANAGIDAFAHDPFVISAAEKADVTVVQVMGAQNMTNRFYAVHPRRNDRFVSASSLLKTIFREVDFADFHFNKHMLSRLNAESADRFEILRSELQEAWIARMRLMLNRIVGKTILLWFADRGLDDAVRLPQGDLGADPLFVTRDMVERVRPNATAVVEVAASKAALAAGTRGMLFGELEELAAQNVLGPMAHQEAADAVLGAVRKLM